MKSHYWLDKASQYTVLEFLNPETGRKIESESITIDKIIKDDKTLWTVSHGHGIANLSKSLVDLFLSEDFPKEQYKHYYYYFSFKDNSDYFYSDCCFPTKEEALAYFLQIKNYYIETFSNDCMFQPIILD